CRTRRAVGRPQRYPAHLKAGRGMALPSHAHAIHRAVHTDPSWRLVSVSTAETVSRRRFTRSWRLCHRCRNASHPGTAAAQLLLHELLHGPVLGKSAEHVALFVSRNAFRQMAVRPFLGDEGRHLAVFDAADPDALPERHIEFLARLRIGRVENVVAVDVEAARPAELPPFGEKFSILVEDLNAVV